MKEGPRRWIRSIHAKIPKPVARDARPIKRCSSAESAGAFGEGGPKIFEKKNEAQTN